MGYDEVLPGIYPLNEYFGGIYTPNVMFFRYPIEEYFALREKRFSCGVISVSSLSYKHALGEGNSSPHFEEDGHLSEAGKQVQANKIRTILRIALYHGHDALVLGAFGCGDYGLNPDEIARIFFEVFQEEEFSDRFKKVIFAIKERKSRGKIIGEEGLYKPFYDQFKR